jgi:ribonuclease HI
MKVENQRQSESSLAPNSKHLRMFFDGAGCRPNGEGSGFAWLCPDTNQRQVVRVNGLTNNQAEYKAFLAALQHVPEDSTVEMFSDSQLVCAQFAGQYRAKDPALQALLSEAHALIRDKRLKVNLQWVFRNQNLAGKLL